MLKSKSKLSLISSEHRLELISLYLSTFLLRTGFGGAILLFDWLLIWALEISYGVDSSSNASSIFLISFAAITYYIAEILLTGYYGSKSDKIGVKPVILYATIGAFFVLIFYAPSSLIFAAIADTSIAILVMTAYLSLIHFVHGVFASAKVAPSLGFINQSSTHENRALHMAWYDNAILYGRAAGIMLGGFLWILLEVDDRSDLDDQASQIAKTFLFLTIPLLLATLLIIFGLKNRDHIDQAKTFSIKEDIRIAATVMLQPHRRAMLLPWISIAGLIGSASLWGPTVSFIISGHESENRGWEALLPIMIILIGLALPAPLWGIFADRKGRKLTLLVGLIGLPFSGVLGLLAGYPFYKDDLSISNIPFLLSLVPATFFFSALIPVLMGILGDTAEENMNGEVMSGYHFVIATGEIIGILVGGIVIGFFSLFQDLFGIFGDSDDANGFAILTGFVLFELSLVLGMVIGILKLPEQHHTKE
ncbi:MAG: MFS transporter [Candidatus Kariarchaeaceae archaeon]